MIWRILPLKRIERNPWEMFYIGLFYASIAFFVITYFFSKDAVLNQYRGILLTLITLICCFPYFYFFLKQEEGKDLEISEEGKLIKEHWKAIMALIWLFIGLTIGFGFWYLVLPGEAPKTFDAQIKTFCSINSPGGYEECLKKYGVVTGSATDIGHFFGILINNIGVMMITLFSSIIFGAGAIFILIWNASVIGAAIGMFSKDVVKMHFGVLRYFIHGIPEIAAYFVAALAGGIISVAFVRRDLKGERLWIIMEDAIILVILSVLILIASAFIEVYITPLIIR
ncbi:MAG: stage II sporulation protein M [Candidatus Pacearchaeota archaeon]